MFKERVLEIANDAKAHDAARISAFQLCGENDFTEAVEAVREVMFVAKAANDADRNVRAPIPLTTVAIGTLGFIGDEGYLAGLKAMAAGGASSPRLTPAINAAIKRLEEKFNLSTSDMFQNLTMRKAESLSIISVGQRPTDGWFRVYKTASLASEPLIAGFQPAKPFARQHRALPYAIDFRAPPWGSGTSLIERSESHETN